MRSDQYDVIVIGTGAGGGTLLSKLVHSGKRILVLERGDFLPREKENWQSTEVFSKSRYHTKEVWFDKEGKELHPGTGYWVGGNTKVYGAALFRLRENDFEKVTHAGSGVSPEWPVKYRDWEPYYAAAEKLYEVRGQHGLDPTDPPRSTPYPFPPISHEPRIQEMHDALTKRGLHPFYLPLGVRLNEANRVESACIKCNTCDGFPCLVDAKSDSDVICVRPALRHPNVTLLTNAHVTRIATSASGRAAEGVWVTLDGESVLIRADLVVLAAGAINSAVVLLRSATDKHPQGLANGSGLVGRNFMKHHNGTILALSTRPNPTTFQKTMGINDFYWGEDGFPSPMGHVQLLGKVDQAILAEGAPAIAPGFALNAMGHHSIDWWLTAEDLPLPENRVRFDGERIILQHTDKNQEGFHRLMERWKATLKDADEGCRPLHCALYLGRRIPLEGVGHQCGTCRFGTDPSTSVLDVSCRAHEVENLYVVDGSFFPSSGAVNPSLTIMANALRVGDHLLERLR